ncbi:MAG: FHA domain-containing protein [Fuerstiella sp.]
MSVFLRVLSPSGPKDVAILQQGAALRIGRGEHNDVSFAEDHLMSFEHCLLQMQDSSTCELTDLQSTNGTFVDDKPVETATLAHGSRFVCGETEFSLECSSSPVTAEQPAPAKRRPRNNPGPRRMTAPGYTADGPPPARAKEDAAEDVPELERKEGFCDTLAMNVVARFKLHQKIRLTPEDDDTPDKFIDRLKSASISEAICFLSFALPKRCAVWWAVECVRASADPSEQDEDLLLLTEQWLREPTDDNRRCPLEYMTVKEMDSLATWPAQAAFYADGSTTPIHSAAVPAKDDLAGTMVLAAVSLSAVEGEPEGISQRQEQFLDLGLAIASGEHPWTDAPEIEQG